MCMCSRVRIDTRTHRRTIKTPPADMLIGSRCALYRPALALFNVKGDFSRGNRCSGVKLSIMGAFGGWARGRKPHHLSALDSPFTDILSESEVPNVQPVGIAGWHWEELDCLTLPDREERGNKERVGDRERMGGKERKGMTGIQRGWVKERKERYEMH